jgi:hypothetical protein
VYDTDSGSCPVVDLGISDIDSSNRLSVTSL